MARILKLAPLLITARDMERTNGFRVVTMGSLRSRKNQVHDFQMFWSRFHMIDVSCRPVPWHGRKNYPV